MLVYLEYLELSSWSNLFLYIFVNNIRFRIKVRVFDPTGNAIFVIFDKDGMVLFNKTCAEMYEKEDKVSLYQYQLLLLHVLLYLI